ncbi:hypothetical protein [Allobranchiibius sp. GilTou73]|uniref:hypothetical protein n=1 Tax=Allobranchiibius sp. GilTou73 TaxID=2904523 RepID=UPI001F20B35C|nr:hypothetical protein [Allobranchiibius sp. GilTou73]UIJ35545.1 hypothetical protein LVQ62_03900 [Allobranchiibius sp. GilTou73]
MNVLILLTAAVTPDPAFLAGDASFWMTLADPQVRAGQYRAAVDHWSGVAHAVGGRVAVVETSGADRGDVTRRTDVGYVSYSLPAGLASGGKGAIEAAAIDHALDTLDPAPDTVLVKVTGRLLVENAARVIGPVGDATVQVRRSLDRAFADTRFVVTTVGTWREHLSGMGVEVDDDRARWLERVAAQRLIVGEYAGTLTVQRFPDPPRFVGASGTTGVRYDGWRARVVPPVVQRKAEGAVRRLLGGRLV